MRLFRLLFIALLFTTVYSCGEEGEPCGANSSSRIGAICNDGSRSNATGSGACSSHGGVDYWLCSK